MASLNHSKSLLANKFTTLGHSDLATDRYTTESWS